jgi:hypothetical protein
LAELRFRGLAKTNRDLDKQLSRWLGYKAKRDGDDWAIAQSDRALRAGPADILKLHPQIDLCRTDTLSTARTLASKLPDDFEKYHKTPQSIDVIGEFGLLSEIDEVTSSVGLC